MKEAIEGKIVSSNLGEFSKKRIVYGYIGIETPDKKHFKVKIDSYTEHETLTIGDEVIVEVHALTGTDILVARKIHLKSTDGSSPEEMEATV